MLMSGYIFLHKYALGECVVVGFASRWTMSFSMLQNINTIQEIKRQIDH